MKFKMSSEMQNKISGELIEKTAKNRVFFQNCFFAYCLTTNDMLLTTSYYKIKNPPIFDIDNQLIKICSNCSNCSNCSRYFIKK